MPRIVPRISARGVNSGRCVSAAMYGAMAGGAGFAGTDSIVWVAIRFSGFLAHREATTSSGGGSIRIYGGDRSMDYMALRMPSSGRVPHLPGWTPWPQNALEGIANESGCLLGGIGGRHVPLSRRDVL